ncbi:hypothetical protein GCM10011490_23590 [Pseudoclavibacter endophyticus]|nr:hypothetical protein GCM10011490_23590 [Pseudoclavibacter endophyticus]
MATPVSRGAYPQAFSRANSSTADPETSSAGSRFQLTIGSAGWVGGGGGVVGIEVTDPIVADAAADRRGEASRSGVTAPGAQSIHPNRTGGDGCRYDQGSDATR